MKQFFYHFPLSLLILFVGCEQKKTDHQGEANAYMHQTKFEELVARFESPKRAKWQKPDEVMRLLGPLEGKKVMDLGCGSGYFTVRLLAAGASVIAADVNQEFLDYIKKRVEEETESAPEISYRKLPNDSPKLEAAEVDMVLTVNVYHHIENRAAYFTQVKQGLAPEGKLVIVDFFKKETPKGPPYKMRIPAEQVEKELLEAGFKKFEVRKDVLPYQYILIAQ